MEYIVDYVIDFDRINKLTYHTNDNPKEGYGGSYAYGISKSLIKDYIEIYMDRIKNNLGKMRYSEETFKEAIDILHYNRILISKSDMRDKKIVNILE